jgi:hypothetical protein
MLSSRQRFIEETKICILKLILKLQMCDIEMELVDGDRIRIYVNYKVVATRLCWMEILKVWR